MLSSIGKASEKSDTVHDKNTQQSSNIHAIKDTCEKHTIHTQAYNA